MSRSRLIFIVFYMTAVLITAVLLRTNSSRIFYKFRLAHVAQNRLNQQLCQKQLIMATLTTPGEISERVKKAESESDGQ
jgi:hypothetical protein